MHLTPYQVPVVKGNICEDGAVLKLACLASPDETKGKQWSLKTLKTIKAGLMILLDVDEHSVLV